MLARPHRLLRGSDYRRVVRRGRRVKGRATTAYLLAGNADLPARFGFIVSKAIGNAPVRNRFRRRLKAAAYRVLSTVPPGTDVVIRVLPGGVRADWTTLLDEVTRAIDEGLTR